MKKFNLGLAFVLISLVGLTPEGVSAAAAGTLSVVSSDDTVLTVTPLDGGLFRLDFHAEGHAALLVDYGGDEATGTAAFDQAISLFVVDETKQVDHFEIAVVDPATVGAATAAVDPAAGSGDAPAAAGESEAAVGDNLASAAV